MKYQNFNKQSYGSIRKVKGVGAVGILMFSLLMGLTVSQSVQAEEVTTVNPTPAEETTATVEGVSEAPVIVTEDSLKADYAQAQSDVAQAEAEVKAQEQVVTGVQSEVNDLNNQVSTLQSEIKSDTTAYETAIAEGEDNVNQAIDNANARVSELEAERPVKEAQAQEVKEQVTAQEQVVAEKASQVEDVKSDVATAQKAVDDVENVLKSTEIGRTVEQLNQLESEVNQTKSALDTATNNLNSAQGILSNLQASQPALTSEKAQYESAIKSNEADVKEQQTILAQNQDSLNKVVEKINGVSNQLQSINTILTTPEYVEALRKYKASLGKSDPTEYEAMTAKLKEINDSVRALNTFKSNPEDEKVVLTDLNNLSEEVRTELTLFTADLINQVRTAFGTTLVTVTPSSIYAADVVTDGYVEDNWTWSNVVAIGHDDKAIGEAEATTGISRLGENLNTWGASYPSLTLNKLKEMAYQAMVAFLYNGREWAHAISITGLNHDNYRGHGANYIGVDVSTDGKTRTSIHVNGIEVADGITLPANFNYTALTSGNDVTSLTTQLNQLQGQRVSAEKQVANTLATIGSLNAEHDGLESKLAQVVSQLAQVDAKAKEVEALKSTVASAQEAYNVAKTAYDLATADNARVAEIRAQLNADLTAKKQVLQTAKDELNRATEVYNVELSKLQVVTNAYDSALAEVKAVDTEIANQKAFIESAKAKLQSWKDMYANLVNKGILLNEKANLLATKTSELEVELEKLASLKANYDTVYADFKALEAQLIELGIIEEPVDEVPTFKEEKLSPHRLLSSESLDLTDMKLNKVTISTNEQMNHSSNAKSSQASDSNRTTLPNTGESSDMMAEIGLVLLSLGLVGRVRKRN